MAREEETMMCCPAGGGIMVVLAALLLALGMLGGGYLLSQGDYAPKVNVSSGDSMPNVYVSSTPPDHAIAVSGTVSQKVAPDLLNIQVRVQTEAANAKKSQEDNAAVSAELLTAIKALGLTENDIQTISYSVQPVYDSTYECDTKGSNCHYDSVLRGYQTIHSLNLRVTDLDKGGDIIDAAGSAGTNQTFVDYVQFTLKDETKRSLEKSLLQNASAECKSKAQSIATGLGVSVGNVLSASESFSYPVYYKAMYAMEASGASPAPSTQLSAGQVDVSATVSSTFEVK